jgi:hypothetical protein
MKNFDRFFAFGCSFTRYSWPTWADIIGLNFSNSSYYNYGYWGVGNHYIFNAIMEADQRHKFTSQDLIIVQWASHLRFDFYWSTEWRNIRPHDVSVKKYKEYIRDIFDERGHIIRDIAMIKSAKDLLDNRNCHYKFIPIVPLLWIDEYQRKQSSHDDILELYGSVFDKMETSFIEFLGDYSKFRPIYINNVKIEDNHPVPSDHDNYIKNILPEFWTNRTNFIKQLDLKVSELVNTPDKGWHYSWPEINRGIIVDRL